MNTDLFTEKAREAIVAAQQLADERRNSQLEPEHVLLALLGQQEIVQPLALQLLQGTFHDGDRIVVEVEKGHFTFRRQAEVPPMATPVH